MSIPVQLLTRIAARGREIKAIEVVDKDVYEVVFADGYCNTVELGSQIAGGIYFARTMGKAKGGGFIKLQEGDL